MDGALPPLPQIELEHVDKLAIPTLKIRYDEDVSRWKSTRGYQNYNLFLRRLSESVVGYDLPQKSDENSTSNKVSYYVYQKDNKSHWK